MRKNLFLLIAIMLIGSVSANASALFNKGAGTTGAQMLKLPASIGELTTGAVIASDNGAANVTINPANILMLPGNSVSFLYSSWYSDAGYGYAGFTKSSARGGFGLGIKYVGYGSLQDRTKDDSASTAGRTFGATDMALTAAYSKLMGTAGAAGVSISYIRQGFSISGAKNVSGISVDLGLTKRVLPDLFVAGTVRRIGYLTQGNTLLPEVAAGARYTMLKGKNLGILGELRAPLDNTPSVSVGADYTIGKIMKISAGINTADLMAQGILPGIGLGVGVKVSMISIDFGYKPAYKGLGSLMGGVLLMEMKAKF